MAPVSCGWLLVVLDKQLKDFYKMLASLNCLLLGKTSFGIDDLDIMKLWKVDIAYDDEDKLKHVTTEDNIKKMLGDKILIPTSWLRNFFGSTASIGKDNVSDTKDTKDNADDTKDGEMDIDDDEMETNDGEMDIDDDKMDTDDKWIIKRLIVIPNLINRLPMII
ncbi:16843_t:CDS:2 [Rhizophagus irregularis]|nr:16843_t:CDS:2 [Rhizophagus irregularis]